MWQSMKSAPKDGTKIEILVEGEFPILAYYGGGEDKAFREWNSCRQIQNAKGWRHVGYLIIANFLLTVVGLCMLMRM